MSQSEKIYVAGHRGMVGSAIVRTLLAQGTPASSIVTRTHAELDLCRQQDVQDFFAQEKPDQVYLAAAKVRGAGPRAAPARRLCRAKLRRPTRRAALVASD